MSLGRQENEQQKREGVAMVFYSRTAQRKVDSVAVDFDGNNTRDEITFYLPRILVQDNAGDDAGKRETVFDAVKNVLASGFLCDSKYGMLGGAVDAGETKSAALARELHEEVIELLHTQMNTTSTFQKIRLLARLQTLRTVIQEQAVDTLPKNIQIYEPPIEVEQYKNEVLRGVFADVTVYFVCIDEMDAIFNEVAGLFKEILLGCFFTAIQVDSISQVRPYGAAVLKLWMAEVEAQNQDIAEAA